MNKDLAENATSTISEMWSKNPFFMLIILLMLVPMVCAFLFCFYILQTYNASLTKLSDNIMLVKVELEKQTDTLGDIRDDLAKIQIQQIYDAGRNFKKK